MLREVVSLSFIVITAPWVTCLLGLEGGSGGVRIAAVHYLMEGMDGRPG